MNLKRSLFSNATFPLRSFRRFLCLALLTTALNAHAQTVTQTNNGTGGALDLTSSWLSGTVPTSAQIALFNSNIAGAQTDMLGASMTWGELQLTNPFGAVTISGDASPFTLTLAGIQQTSTSSLVTSGLVTSGTAVGIDMSASSENLTFGIAGSADAAVAITSNQTWLIKSGQSVTLLGTAPINLNGNTLTIADGGTLSVNYNSTGTNTSTGNYIVNGSTLLLNYGAIQTNPLGTSGLTLAGSTFKATETAALGKGTDGIQTFSALTLNAGASSVSDARNASDGDEVIFTTVARNAGGIINLSATADAGSNGAQHVAIGGPANGTVLGYATDGVSDFAATEGTGTGVAVATYTTNTWGSTTATNVTTSNTASALTTNALRFNTAGTETVTLATGTSVITTGAILMGGTVAAFNSTITGGNLTSGNGTDLILINNDTAPGAAGNLIINSAITDNSTPIGITAGKTTTLAVGQIQLGGTNTFTGASYIDGGATVVLESAGAWNGSGTSFSALNFAPNEGTTTGGTFDLNGFNATVGGLATTEAGLNATVQNLSASTASTLTINLSGGSNTYAGTIADGGGAALNLATSGSGTLILAGANTYSGGTTIGGGTLLANGSASTGTGEVTVANGGFLGGSGTINTSGVTSGNALTIASGGTLSQTAVSAGLGASSLTLILQAGTTVNLNSGAELAFDLGASGVSDQMYITGGTLTLNSQSFASFTFTTLSTFTGSGTYDLIVTGGTGDIIIGTALGTLTGTINGSNAILSLAANASGTQPGTQYVVLTVTAPEPSTWDLLLVGLGLIAVCRLRTHQMTVW